MTIRLLGLNETQQALRRLGRERLDVAIAAGLNRTLVQVDRAEKISLGRSLDRPTPFTINSTRIAKADRNRLTGRLFVMNRQSEYLGRLVRGGTIDRELTPVLRNVVLDAHGNLPGIQGGIKRVARELKVRELSARYGRRRGKGRSSGLPADMFIGSVNGVRGLWQRIGRNKLNLLVKFERNVRRRRQWDFYGVAERTARGRLANDIRDAIAREIAAL